LRSLLHLTVDEALMITLTINGTPRQIEADPEMPLLWAIRDHLDLTGTKYGCGIAQCGACTVHVDGQPVRSCQTRVGDVGDGRITTIEGVNGRVAEAVQTAWRKLDVVQCGYCQSGQLLSAAGLLARNPAPSDADIDAAMAGNVCRCGTYVRIREGIAVAATTLAAGTRRS
jgi:isoquinoline 1-oxidoreductase alpha subunit